MGVTAGTTETYSNTLIFEDLSNAFEIISPTECPFQQAIGKGSCESTSPEWPIVTLNAVSDVNRVIEGEDAPNAQNPTLGERIGTYTQISDKKIVVSHSSEASNAAAENIQRLSKQMVLKMKEMKRDMEVMLLANVPAVPGSSGVARQTAGFVAWLRTNTSFGATGADPTLSGGVSGYPNAAAVNGTVRTFTEKMFNDVSQLCWNQGGDPSFVLVDGNNKRIISETFVGKATRYKDSVDQKVINSIDFYEGDFGMQTIVPSRFLWPTDGQSGTHHTALMIDPSFVSLITYDPVQEKPLAETGHAKSRLLWTEYALRVDNEAAHGAIRDLNGTIV